MLLTAVANIVGLLIWTCNTLYGRSASPKSERAEQSACSFHRVGATQTHHRVGPTQTQELQLDKNDLFSVRPRNMVQSCSPTAVATRSTLADDMCAARLPTAQRGKFSNGLDHFNAAKIATARNTRNATKVQF